METRIQKYFTDCGVLSRRAAEAEIEAGLVTVNGVRASVGQKIDTERDVVKYLGKRVEMQSDRHLYIALNKPRGCVTTSSDEKGRRCVTDLVADLGERVYPVGRLDMDSDGLLLLTNDGELTNFLTHPRHMIGKVYHVRVKGRLTPEKASLIGQSIEINGADTRPVGVKIIDFDERSTLLELTLFEGKNRQIRRMCEDKGAEVLKLTRVAIGKITLGSLQPGRYRRLTGAEIKYLKNEMKKEKGREDA